MLSTELKYYLSGRGGIGRRASFRYSYLWVWEFKSPRPHKDRKNLSNQKIKQFIFGRFDYNLIRKKLVI